MRIPVRELLSLLPKILLILIPVALIAYFAGRQVSVEPPPTFPDPHMGGTALTPEVEDRFSLPPNTLYVPVYSHIYVESGQSTLLTVTLSVRNTSPAERLVLDSVEYFDTGGNWLRDYLEVPLLLGPLETLEFLVPEDDTAGGSGANFLVHYRTESLQAAAPLVEAIMMARTGSGIVSFARPGVPIAKSEPAPNLRGQ